MMTKLAAVLLAGNLVACVMGDNEQPKPADPDPANMIEPIAFPKTCAEAARGHATPADGDRTLYVDGNDKKPWTAYCVDMDSKSPAAYLTLPQGGANTFSMYRAGGRAIGTDVVTRFDKLRIDPTTLTIDVTDTTFAISSGSLAHVDGTTITEMPLGVAMSCGGGYASAIVSVAGTPFVMANDFAKGGDTGHVGNADLWQDNNVVEIWADGDCGWLAPTAMDSPIAPSTKLALRLTYL